MNMYECMYACANYVYKKNALTKFISNHNTTNNQIIIDNECLVINNLLLWLVILRNKINLDPTLLTKNNKKQKKN